MGHNRLTVKTTHLLCGTVLFLCLLPGQTWRLFGISGGIIYQIVYYFHYFASAFLFMYALSKKRKIPNSEIYRFFYIFIPLIVLMLIVEFFAVFTSPVPEMYGIRYWTRSLSVFLDRLSIYVTVVSVWLLCADKAIDCLANTLLIDELLVLISALIQEGIINVGQNIVSAFSFKGFTDNFFEVHELTFAIGLCIIYYLFFQKFEKKSIARIVLLIISFILGAKRIGLFGIVVAGLFALFIHKKGLTRRKLILTGFAGVIICFFYLFIIYNNEFFAILNERNINNMGRDLVYGYFVNRTTFSPAQTGWGMAGVAKVVENMDRSEVLYMTAVRGLHNDILKIYIDFGFFGSLIWYIINLVYIPVKILKQYGKRPATIYMALAIYMFITYLTDNTEGYNVCQMAFLLIPLAEYWIEKIRNEKVSKIEFYNNEIQRNSKKVIVPE